MNLYGIEPILSTVKKYCEENSSYDGIALEARVNDKYSTINIFNSERVFVLDYFNSKDLDVSFNDSFDEGSIDYDKSVDIDLKDKLEQLPLYITTNIIINIGITVFPNNMTDDNKHLKKEYVYIIYAKYDSIDTELETVDFNIDSLNFRILEIDKKEISNQVIAKCIIPRCYNITPYCRDLTKEVSAIYSNLKDKNVIVKISNMMYSLVARDIGYIYMKDHPVTYEKLLNESIKNIVFTLDNKMILEFKADVKYFMQLADLALFVNNSNSVLPITLKIDIRTLDNDYNITVVLKLTYGEILQLKDDNSCILDITGIISIIK